VPFGLLTAFPQVYIYTLYPLYVRFKGKTASYCPIFLICMYLDVKGVCKMECFWWFIHRYRYSKVYLKMLSGYPRRKESTKKENR
jgi:hypothetical protein